MLRDECAFLFNPLINRVSTYSLHRDAAPHAVVNCAEMYKWRPTPSELCGPLRSSVHQKRPKNGVLMVRAGEIIQHRVSHLEAHVGVESDAQRQRRGARPGQRSLR
jgi:hypothetical protein